MTYPPEGGEQERAEHAPQGYRTPPEGHDQPDQWWGPPQQSPQQYPPGPWGGQWHGQQGYSQHYGQQYGQQGWGQHPYGQHYAQPGYGGYGQPPYPPGPNGHPYGAGDGAPPRKKRTGLVAGLIAGLAVVAAVVVVLSLTLGGRVLDRAAVQRDVAQQFEQHEGVAIRITCDRTMTLVQGATYPCRGTTADGENVALQIRITDAARARYTWSEQG